MELLPGTSPQLRDDLGEERCLIIITIIIIIKRQINRKPITRGLGGGVTLCDPRRPIQPHSQSPRPCTALGDTQRCRRSCWELCGTCKSCRRVQKSIGFSSLLLLPCAQHPPSRPEGFPLCPHKQWQLCVPTVTPMGCTGTPHCSALLQPRVGSRARTL